MHEEIAQQVDHGDARPVAGRRDGQAAAGSLGGEVRRPDEPLAAGEVGDDLAPPPGVVPEREHVDARREQLVGELGRDPDAVGGVLAVGDAEVDVELLAQPRQPLLDRAETRAAVHVGDEEDSQGMASVAGRWSSIETWFPASCV